jgi:hypothetical protein
MSKIILHIGLEKTGTTSVQEFLVVNRDPLVKSGYFVPTCFKHSNHYEMALLGLGGIEESKLLKWAGLSGRDLKEFSDHLLEAIGDEIVRDHTCLVSSEFLTSQIDSRYGPSEIIRKLKFYFDEIEAIVFIRRPEQLLASRYSTTILAGSTQELDIDKAAQRRIASQLLFEKVIANWQSALGSENLTFRVFPEKTFGVSVIERYLDSIGANFQQGNWNDTNLVTNKRLSKRGLELIRMMNQVQEKFTQRERKLFINHVKFLTSSHPEFSLSPHDFERVSLSYYETVLAHSNNLKGDEVKEFLSFEPSFDNKESWESIKMDDLKREFSNICRSLNIRV